MPTVETYRGDPDGLNRRDHYWRCVSGHDVVADGSEGYRNRKDMAAGMWAALAALVRWAMKRDRVRLEQLVGECSTEEA